MSPDRQAFFAYGGSMLGGPGDAPRDLIGLLRAAPAALAVTLFSPNPWTRYTSPGSTGVLRRVAVVETLLVALLVCLGVVGLARSIRTTGALGFAIAFFAVTLAIGLGFAVPNIGALFRLRLAVIVAVCLLAGQGVLAMAGRSASRPVRRAVAYNDSVQVDR